MQALRGRVTLVTGASRGVGRGVAHELGLAGATVYVTGRSRDGAATTDDLPGTIDETARLVSDAGGTGIAVECDHCDDAAVSRLAARVRDDVGRLDILVNNVWGGYEQYDPKLFGLPVWEQPLWRWDRMMNSGLRAHYTATRALLPLMLDATRGLIINISAGDDGHFLGDVQYDTAKSAVDRLAWGLARKLRKHRIIALSLHPGFTRTERVLAAKVAPEVLATTHSARFVGRCVVALATDPDLEARSGGAFKAGQLGRDYGFTDIDGSQPEPFRIPDQDA